MKLRCLRHSAHCSNKIMDSLYIYIGILVLVVVAVMIIRKVTSCLLKSIIGLLVLAIAAYFLFIAH